MQTFWGSLKGELVYSTTIGMPSGWKLWPLSVSALKDFFKRRFKDGSARRRVFQQIRQQPSLRSAS